MGIGYSSNSASLTQNINNSVLNASTANCSASCTEISQNNTIIINGTTINGNFEINQTCDVEASCTINSTLNTQVQNIISSLAQQTAATLDGFPPSFSLDAATNNLNVAQNITTSIANIINSSCQSSANLVSQDNFTYFSNDTINGSVQFNQDANVNLSCTLNNISSIVASNSESSQISQTATVVNTTALLLILIVVVIIVIVGIFLVSKLFKGGGKSSKIEVTPATAEAAAA